MNTNTYKINKRLHRMAASVTTRFLLIAGAFLLSLSAFAQTGTPMFSVSPGTAANTIPFGQTITGSNRAQFLYLANEFTGARAGMITAVYVKPTTTTSSTTFTNFQVRL